MNGGAAVLIACGRAKQEVPAAAVELYTGQHFRLARAAAEAVGDPFVVSGLHGIVPGRQVLAPYDQPMGAGPVRAAAAQVVAGINSRDLVVALLPRAYLAHAAGHGVRIDLDAFAGCRGIGQQRTVLASLAQGSVRVPAVDPAQVGRAMAAAHRIAGRPDRGLLLTFVRGGWTEEHLHLDGDGPLPRGGGRAFLMPLDEQGRRQLPAAAAELDARGSSPTVLPAPGREADPADPLLEGAEPRSPAEPGRPR